MIKIPHVHAAIIKAWADGAEIDVFDYSLQHWCPVVQPLFAWYPQNTYRIKPEPKPDSASHHRATLSYVSCGTVCRSNVDNLKLTYDGETGELKAAEVL